MTDQTTEPQEEEFTCPYCRRPIPNELHTCEKCGLIFNPEEMGKPGYVARVKGGLEFDCDDLEFLMDKKSKLRKEKIFPSRFHCIDFLHNIQHNCPDDMRYMAWFVDGEDIKRNLWTGEIEEKTKKVFFGFLG